MRYARGRRRANLSLEVMEERNAPSTGSGAVAAASQPSHALQHARFRFIARLSPANIVSTTNGNTTTVSTPTAGTIIFQLTPDGKTTNVAGGYLECEQFHELYNQVGRDESSVGHR